MNSEQESVLIDDDDEESLTGVHMSNITPLASHFDHDTHYDVDHESSSECVFFYSIEDFIPINTIEWCLRASETMGSIPDENHRTENVPEFTRVTDVYTRCVRQTS